MKRKIRAAAFLAAVLFMVSGCGNAQGHLSEQEKKDSEEAESFGEELIAEPEPEEEENSQGSQEGTEKAESTKKTSKRHSDAELEERAAVIATYATFLDGIGEVTLLGDSEYYHSSCDYRNGYPEFSAGQKWTLDDFTEFTIKIGDESGNLTGTLYTEYAFLDLENDFTPELLLHIQNQTEDDYGISYETYCIIGYLQGEMCLLWISTESNYWNGGCDFGHYGIIRGTSMGDAVSEEVIYLLGADGQRYTVYSSSHYYSEWRNGAEGLGHDIAYDPKTDTVDGDLLEELDSLFNELDGCPGFLETGSYIIGDEKYFTYELKKEIGGIGDRKKCKQYIAFCESKGANFVTEEELDALIRQRAESLGFSEIWDLEEECGFFTTGDELTWLTWIQTKKGAGNRVNPWKAEYLSVLEEYFDGKRNLVNDEAVTFKEHPDSYYFSLEDLNGDGEEELVIVGEDTYTDIYHLDSDGAAAFVGNMSKYDPYKGYILCEGGVSFSSVFAIYAFDGVDMEPIVSLYEYDDGEGDTYYSMWDNTEASDSEIGFEETEISEAEYNAILSQYSGPDYNWMEPKNTVKFTVENIEDVFDVDISNVYGDWIITGRKNN